MFFMPIKSIKSIKSTKSTKRQTSDFLPLRCFYAHKNAVFFVFVRLYAFCAFCACEIFLQKKIKRFKIALIPSFTVLLMSTPLNLPMESYLYTLIFIYDHLLKSLLFMRIFLNLFLLMIICKSLFESLLIYDHL